jgi:hypothetical protein
VVKTHCIIDELAVRGNRLVLKGICRPLDASPDGNGCSERLGCCDLARAHLYSRDPWEHRGLKLVNPDAASLLPPTMAYMVPVPNLATNAQTDTEIRDTIWEDVPRHALLVHTPPLDVGIGAKHSDIRGQKHRVCCRRNQMVVAGSKCNFPVKGRHLGTVSFRTRHTNDIGTHLEVHIGRWRPHA